MSHIFQIKTTVLDDSEVALKRGERAIQGMWASTARKGRLSLEQVAQRTALLSFTTVSLLVSHELLLLLLLLLLCVTSCCCSL